LFAFTILLKVKIIMYTLKRFQLSLSYTYNYTPGKNVSYIIIIYKIIYNYNIIIYNY